MFLYLQSGEFELCVRTSHSLPPELLLRGSNVLLSMLGIKAAVGLDYSRNNCVYLH